MQSGPACSRSLSTRSLCLLPRGPHRHFEQCRRDADSQACGLVDLTVSCPAGVRISNESRTCGVPGMVFVPPLVLKRPSRYLAKDPAGSN